MEKKEIRKILIVIIITILSLVVLLPFLPYKSSIGLIDPRYTKLKVICSSQDGIVTKEEYDNRDNIQELHNYLDEDSLNSICDELTVIKYGVSGNILNLYGEFIEDSNGNKKFHVEKWSSPNTMLIDTYLWKDKISYVYVFIGFPAFVLLIIIIFFITQEKRNYNE